MMNGIYLVLSLLVMAVGITAHADENILVGKGDTLTLSVGQDKKTNRYVLSVTAKVGARVVTSKQDCQSKEECDGIKKGLEDSKNSLGTDEKLALQLQTTQTVGKIVKGSGTAALSETVFRNFPVDGVMSISGDGLMTNQYYQDNDDKYTSCRINSAEPVLVKNDGILVISGALTVRNSDYHYCDIPVTHSVVSSITCYNGSNSKSCADMDLAAVNRSFKDRMTFYFPASKVVQNTPKTSNNAKTANSGDEDTDATVKKLDTSNHGKAKHKNKANGVTTD